MVPIVLAMFSNYQPGCSWLVERSLILELANHQHPYYSSYEIGLLFTEKNTTDPLQGAPPAPRLEQCSYTEQLSVGALQRPSQSGLALLFLFFFTAGCLFTECELER